MTLFRLFYNALLTYIFIYVDIISRANDPSRPDVILLAIAIYGSAYLLLKTVLALVNHIIWIFCLCCQTKSETQRFSTIDNFWKNEFEIWSKLGNSKNINIDSNVYRRWIFLEIPWFWSFYYYNFLYIKPITNISINLTRAVLFTRQWPIKSSLFLLSLALLSDLWTTLHSKYSSKFLTKLIYLK